MLDFHRYGWMVGTPLYQRTGDGEAMVGLVRLPGTHEGRAPGSLPGPRAPERDPAKATAAALIAVAEDLAGEFLLRPLLERILLRCTELLGCDAGSICSVDEAAGTYRKEADIGVRCQSGQVFPLTEGMTGLVVANREPIWLARYDEVPGGHVAAPDRATLRGVIGVPLSWRGSIVGACIVFSRDPSRVFGPDDAELLQLFATHAAVALANARMYAAAEERARTAASASERDRLFRELYDTLSQGLVGVLSQLDAAETRDLPLVREARASASAALVETRRTMLGLSASPLETHSIEDVLRAEVDWAQRTGRLDGKFVLAGVPVLLERDVADEIVRIAQEALTNIVQHAQAKTVRLGIAYETHGVSLLVQDDGQGSAFSTAPDDAQFGLRGISERALAVGGQLEVDSLPGWGTSVRVRFPYSRPTAGPKPRGPRVIVVAAQPLVRSGVTRLLSMTEPGIEVVGEAASASEARAMQRRVQADVVITSLRLDDGSLDRDDEGSDAVDLTRQLMATQPSVGVLGLCEPGDDVGVTALLRAGARGCIDLNADGPTLAQAVIAAGHGQAVLSMTALRHLSDGVTEPSSLTPRERQVRALVEEGLSDKLIAERLVISVKTVEKHVGALLRKTGAHSRTEVAARGRVRVR
jgi:signal transduction histidine kinase/DNA-binding NarL/FixJ family response regulator